MILYRDLAQGNPTYQKQRSLSPKASPRASSPRKTASVVSVSRKRVSVSKESQISCLLPVSKPRTDDTLSLISHQYSATIARGKDSSSSATAKTFAAVATAVNSEILKARSESPNKSKARKSFPNLVTAGGVRDAIHSQVSSESSVKQPPKKKRRKNKKLTASELYPVSAEDLLKGLPQNRAVALLRDMKDSWKPLGFSASYIPKATMGTQHKTTVNNYGVRRVFEILRLQTVNRLDNGKYVAEKRPRYKFIDVSRPENSSQGHSSQTRFQDLRISEHKEEQ